jgi:hypothetical protein
MHFYAIFWRGALEGARSCRQSLAVFKLETAARQQKSPCRFR